MQDQNELQAENLYLQQTIDTAKNQWTALKQKIKGEEDALSLAFEDMREDVAHDVTNLFSMQGFHDLAELSQYMLPMLGQISAHGTGMQTLRSLENMMDSPYFARIDFQFEGEETAEKIYIGRATLMDPATMVIRVYDWRAPVSSVFYRFGIGKASFLSPGGTVAGEVFLKRQYEIRSGKLLYYFDADVQIQDEFLRQLLSKNASPKMKTIVETIQKDQDTVIRDMENDVLLVQGAAGSGKTSIALHRIAYLLYQGLNNRLTANDILILSPNTVFEEYISHVLPDLGENNVKTMLFEDIYKKELGKVQFYSRSQCLERILSQKDETLSGLMKDSMAFKGSSVFVILLDRLIRDLPKRWIDFQDISYDGRCIAKRELLKASVCQSKKIAPLCIRLHWLEKEILEKVHKLRPGRMDKLTRFVKRYPEHAMEVEPFARWLSIFESASLLKTIRKFTSLSSMEVYRLLFSDKEHFYRLAKGLTLPGNIEEIRRYTVNRFSEDRLWHDDTAALFYLHIRMHGCGTYTGIRQVVLDEAQDEHPLHFAILRELFSGARFTILGDVNQTIGKRADQRLYNEIGSILNKQRTAQITMEKSFRCTMEIWRFSSQFLYEGAAGQCFSRSGDEPSVQQAENADDMVKLLVREAAYCRERGYQSIGLITKTEEDARTLFDELKSRLDLRLLVSGASSDLRGTLILPIALAKGLEFDAVLVCDTDHDHYRTEDDKRLLYIASTRALHRLNLFYTGTISPLIHKPGQLKEAF